jgi:hypothetical protein
MARSDQIGRRGTIIAAVKLSERSSALMSHLRRIIDFSFKREDQPGWLWLVLIPSALGLVISISRWWLVNLLTLFIEPVLEIALFGFFALAVLVTLGHAIFANAGRSKNRFGPLLLAAIMTVVFLFVPFTEIYLKANFQFALGRRTEIAQSILQAKETNLGANGTGVEYIKPCGFSEGGICVYQRGRGPDRRLILFLTFSGILEHFSGFVYSANDNPPQRADFNGDLIEIEHMRKNWYWIASH